jgi:hypothetical protein
MGYDAAHGAAAAIGQAGFLKILFPLLAVAGPALFFYFGYLGVVKRRTLFLFRPRGGGGAGWVEGGWAFACGIMYLVVGPLMLVAMGPIAAAIVGLW